MRNFLVKNGITHTFTPAYHPASNGAAEGAVKRAIKKAERDGCDVEIALQAYLMAYRNTAHCTTGEPPAMLLQRRNLRSRLDFAAGERRPSRGGARAPPAAEACGARRRHGESVRGRTEGMGKELRYRRAMGKRNNH